MEQTTINSNLFRRNTLVYLQKTLHNSRRFLHKLDPDMQDGTNYRDCLDFLQQLEDTIEDISLEWEDEAQPLE